MVSSKVTKLKSLFKTEDEANHTPPRLFYLNIVNINKRFYSFFFWFE